MHQSADALLPGIVELQQSAEVVESNLFEDMLVREKARVDAMETDALESSEVALHSLEPVVDTKHLKTVLTEDAFMAASLRS